MRSHLIWLAAVLGRRGRLTSDLPWSRGSGSRVGVVEEEKTRRRQGGLGVGVVDGLHGDD
jgi:hypothetical protein